MNLVKSFIFILVSGVAWGFRSIPCQGALGAKQLHFSSKSSSLLLHQHKGVPKPELHSSSTSLRASTVEPISNSTKSIARLYRRVSWLSWWFQIILSVIGSVILTFANTVRKGGDTYAIWSSGFALSGIGAIAAVLNALWTWNITRIPRRIALKKIEESRIVPTLKRLSQISVTISLVGMLVTLFAAEQTVGTLASKVLSSQGLVSSLTIGSQLNQIQALDIFLVQANTNVLLSHYFPLAANIWLQTQLPAPAVPVSID